MGDLPTSEQLPTAAAPAVTPSISSAESVWDALLAKYVRVWVWSVLFGTTAGLSYSYIGVRLDRPWGAIAVLPLAILALGIAAAFAAWTSLLLHLRLAILPTFFGYVDYVARNQSPEENMRRASYALLRAYRFFIIAGVSRLLIALTDLIFQVLGTMS